MAPTGKPMQAANFRLPTAMVEALDAEVEVANRAAGYDKFNRSDMIRDLLEQALRARGRLSPTEAKGSPAGTKKGRR